MFQSIHTTNATNIQKSLGKGSAWVIDSVIDHIISILQYHSLAESSYIKCFKLFLVGHLNPTDHHPTRITKVDKAFAETLDFKGIFSSRKLETFTKSKKRIP